MPSGCLNSEAPLGGWFFHGRRRSCELCKEHSEACRRLVALFAIQSLGTARIGHAFGPVMAVWLITIALSGIWGITKYPAVLLSFDPGYALSYLVHGVQRLCRTRWCLPLRHRSRSALRRHGAFRPPTDPDCVVGRRVSKLGAQLC